MSKSTPLNQLPTFADPDASVLGYQEERDDDETVQEVLGDLSSSLSTKKEERKVSKSDAERSERSERSEKSEKPPSIFKTLKVGDQLWLGLFAALMFVVVTLAPIERLVGSIPLLVTYAGSYAALLVRALIMCISIIAAGGM